MALHFTQDTSFWDDKPYKDAFEFEPDYSLAKSKKDDRITFERKAIVDEHKDLTQKLEDSRDMVSAVATELNDELEEQSGELKEYQNKDKVDFEKGYFSDKDAERQETKHQKKHQRMSVKGKPFQAGKGTKEPQKDLNFVPYAVFDKFLGGKALSDLTTEEKDLLRSNWKEFTAYTWMKEHPKHSGNELTGDISKLLPLLSIHKINGHWVTGEVRPRGRGRNPIMVEAKIYNTPSQFGINNGRISKLWIQDSDRTVLVNYDRGWDVKPEEGTPADKLTKKIVTALSPLSPRKEDLDYKAGYVLVDGQKKEVWLDSQGQAWYENNGKMAWAPEQFNKAEGKHQKPHKRMSAKGRPFQAGRGSDSPRLSKEGWEHFFEAPPTPRLADNINRQSGELKEGSLKENMEAEAAINVLNALMPGGVRLATKRLPASWWRPGGLMDVMKKHNISFNAETKKWGLPETTKPTMKLPKAKTGATKYPVMITPEGVKYPLIAWASDPMRSNWEWYGVEDLGNGIYFGYVMGFENEWGNFSEQELNENGIKLNKNPRDLDDLAPPIGWTKGEQMEAPIKCKCGASTFPGQKCPGCGEMADTAMISELREVLRKEGMTDKEAQEYIDVQVKNNFWEENDLEKSGTQKKHIRISPKGKPFQAGQGVAKLPKVKTEDPLAFTPWLRPSETGNEWEEWGGAVRDELENLIGVTTSDAQGIIESQQDKMHDCWVKGKDAKATAKIIDVASRRK